MSDEAVERRESSLGGYIPNDGLNTIEVQLYPGEYIMSPHLVRNLPVSAYRGPASDTIIRTEIRCPTGSNSLLLKVLSKGKPDLKARGTDLLELFCKECTKDFRRIEGLDPVQRVLHIMTTTGEFIQTEIQFKDGAGKEIGLEAQADIIKLSAQFKRGQI